MVLLPQVTTITQQQVGLCRPDLPCIPAIDGEVAHPTFVDEFLSLRRGGGTYYFASMLLGALWLQMIQPRKPSP